MINELDNNKTYYKRYIISKQSLLIWTVFLIYLTQKGLTFTQAMLLSSISGVATFVLEIPSGIIADRMDRKKLLIFGELFHLFSFIIILCTNNFYILIFNSIFSGIGEALVSGCGEALIYESFAKANKHDFYKNYISNVQMWSLRFCAVSTFITGFLYKTNVNLPMILSILIQILAIFYLLKIIDSRVLINYKYDIKTEFKTQLSNIKDILHTKSLLKLFLVYIIMMIIISNINYTSQSYLTYIGIDYMYIGLIFLVFNIISSYGSKYSTRINLNSKLLLVIYSILLISLYFSSKYIVLVLFSISRFINGMIWPILSSDINKKINSDNRATILSYKSLLVQTSFIIFDPIIGFSLDSVGFKYTYFFMGISILVVLIIVITISNYKRFVKLNKNDKLGNS